MSGLKLLTIALLLNAVVSCATSEKFLLGGVKTVIEDSFNGTSYKLNYLTQESVLSRNMAAAAIRQCVAQGDKIDKKMDILLQYWIEIGARK